MRIKIIRVAIIGLFLVIVLDLFYIQVVRGRYYYFLSTNNRIRIVPLEGWRGKIYDRNGVTLADSRIAYNVMVAPKGMHEHQELFRYLSKVLGVDPRTIERRYTRNKDAPFAPVVVAEDIERDKAIILEESKYHFPYLIIQEGYRRTYPQGASSAHVLGYVGKVNQARMSQSKEYGYSPQSIVGYSGVEEFYDSYLKGVEGGLQIEVNSRGQQVRLLSLKEPTKGQDITLTIDSEIQQIARALLTETKGVIIVMDRDNGEILGMTSTPGYDPNVFVSSGREKELSRLFTDPAAPLLNRAIKGLFPPGSVFKVPIAIGAMDSQKINAHTTFICKGHYTLGGRDFGCTHVHGPQDLVQSLIHSCNVYYYHLGTMLGVDVMNKYLQQFGFGQLTYIDLPYEEEGTLVGRRQRYQRTKQQWYAGDTLNFAIGQGDTLVTPLQLVRMMATVANSGVEVHPHVIRAIGGTPVEHYHFRRAVNIDPLAFEDVQKGLRAAVTNFDGTAQGLNMEGLYVAGKTGTAQSSGEQEHHAWFVGYVKNAKKNIVFCVLLEHGGSSQNAVIAAKDLLMGMKEKEIL